MKAKEPKMSTSVSVSYAEVELNCKRMIRKFKGHLESADREKAELVTYANENKVTRADLTQWFIDEGFSYSKADSYARDIIRVVRNARSEIKEGLAEGEISFREARESVVVPTKTRAEKRETKYLRLLREAARDAVLNGLEKENFLQRAGAAFDYAQGNR